jgi:hypothetical protein
MSDIETHPNTLKLGTIYYEASDMLVETEINTGDFPYDDSLNQTWRAADENDAAADALAELHITPRDDDYLMRKEALALALRSCIKDFDLIQSRRKRLAHRVNNPIH